MIPTNRLVTQMSSSEMAAGTLVLELAADGPLSAELVRAVNEFCDRAEDAETGTTGVLRLHGRAHGADGDAVSWPGGEGGIRVINRWERAVRRLERLSVVTVAVLTGRCTGPALDVLLATDYRIAEDDATLTLPTGSGHFWPGMALHRLATQIGVAPTRRLLLHAPELSATAAAELGLLDETTDDAEAALVAKTLWLGDIAGPEFAIRRRLLLDAPTTTFEDALGVHLAACDRALRHDQRVADSTEPGSDPMAAFSGGAR